MKAVIVYASMHHGNTKKLVDAISASNTVELIDATQCSEKNLEEYDLIGFASGVAFSKYYPQMLKFIEKNLPKDKNVFFIHTGGAPVKKNNAAAKAISDGRNCRCLGTYFTKGYDTFGPLKLIGGIARCHPDDRDMAGAVDFFRKIAEAVK